MKVLLFSVVLMLTACVVSAQSMAAHVVVSSPEEDITRLVLADVAKPVRPVGVNGC